jgi:hypothetical protein
MSIKPIHVCWIDRITRDLKLPNQTMTDQFNKKVSPLVGIPNLGERQTKRKCFYTLQSLKANNIRKVSFL